MNLDLEPSKLTFNAQGGGGDGSNGSVNVNLDGSGSGTVSLDVNPSKIDFNASANTSGGAGGTLAFTLQPQSLDVSAQSSGSNSGNIDLNLTPSQFSLNASESQNSASCNVTSSSVELSAQAGQANGNLNITSGDINASLTNGSSSMGFDVNSSGMSASVSSGSTSTSVNAGSSGLSISQTNVGVLNASANKVEFIPSQGGTMFITPTELYLKDQSGNYVDIYANKINLQKDDVQIYADTSGNLKATDGSNLINISPDQFYATDGQNKSITFKTSDPSVYLTFDGSGSSGISQDQFYYYPANSTSGNGIHLDKDTFTIQWADPVSIYGDSNGVYIKTGTTTDPYINFTTSDVLYLFADNNHDVTFDKTQLDINIGDKDNLNWSDGTLTGTISNQIELDLGGDTGISVTAGSSNVIIKDDTKTMTISPTSVDVAAPNNTGFNISGGGSASGDPLTGSASIDSNIGASFYTGSSKAFLGIQSSSGTDGSSGDVTMSIDDGSGSSIVLNTNDGITMISNENDKTTMDYASVTVEDDSSNMAKLDSAGSVYIYQDGSSVTIDGDGISMNLGGTSVLIDDPGDEATWQEISVCVDGELMTMQVLGTEPK